MVKGKGRRSRRELTRKGLDAPRHGGLVLARGGAYGLVAHGQEDDGDEGCEEGRGGSHVPLAEDDAEVGRVPGEEHLFSPIPSAFSFFFYSLSGILHVYIYMYTYISIVDYGFKMSLTFMLHISSPPPPWPPWSPWPGSMSP